MILAPLPSPFRISQKFGERPEVYKQFGQKGHNGIDFVPIAPVKLPVIVYSPIEGAVYEVGDQGNKGYGKYVRIRSMPKKDGIQTECILAHFTTIRVRKGDEVGVCTALGFMGSTGFSTGAHVHLGIRLIGGNGRILRESKGYSGYYDFYYDLISWQKFATPKSVF